MKDLFNIAGPVILAFIALYMAFQVWENFARAKRQNRQTPPSQSLPPAANPAPRHQKVSILKNQKTPPAAPAKSAPPPKRKVSITIKHQAARKIRNQQTDPGVLRGLIDAGAYLHIALGQMWNDSVVEDIYMHNKCIVELDRMVQTENVQLKRPEMIHNVPEIGGIFLGQYARLPEQAKKYLLTIDEFVPIKPAQHDVFQIEFSTESLVMELGDAQDKYPNLSVIGWFHTHPGHGLFLSKPDLAIHNGFFDDEFQIAMEIDSLSENLDTAFFTMNSNGQVNNSIFYKPSWLSWTTIVQNSIF
ncbi:MAG: hypothetical protein IT260_11745 [Saprospiraceae bacterium]|nr:hypothetical protein [Saprospiraceae bacterium]